MYPSTVTNTEAEFSICPCGWLTEGLRCRVSSSKRQRIQWNPNNLHYGPCPLKFFMAQDSLEIRMMNFSRSFQEVLLCYAPFSTPILAIKDMKWEKLWPWGGVSDFDRSSYSSVSAALALSGLATWFVGLMPNKNVESLIQQFLKNFKVVIVQH